MSREKNCRLSGRRRQKGAGNVRANRRGAKIEPNPQDFYWHPYWATAPSHYNGTGGVTLEGGAVMARFKFYAVRRNNKTFAFDRWFGIGGAEEAVEESANDPVKARWKGCDTRQQAETYFDGKNEKLENYEALMEKYLAGDKSVLPRLKKFAEGMKSNGNTTNTRAAKSSIHLDAVQSRRRVHGRADSRSYHGLEKV